MPTWDEFATDLNVFVEKVAQIKLTPRAAFIYIPLPDSIRSKLEEVGKKVLPEGTAARDVDHITLVYNAPLTDDVPAAKVDRLVKELREVTEATPVIKAKVQGWGYFDAAMNDGVSQTALVALIDAPGLEDLHVEMKSACRRAGFEPSSDHTYVPHATFAYLPRGERIKDLPMLDGEFDIDKAMLANTDKHELPLKAPPVGEQAAKAAAAVDRCKVCGKKATVKVLWAEAHGYQPACEEHKEQVAKPFKAKDDFSGFKRYASVGEKAAAHIDELQQAYKRLGPVSLNQRSSWLGPHYDPESGAIRTPAGGAVRNMDMWDLGAPRDPAAQKATNILGGLHEGIERNISSSHGSPGFHGHAHPRVLLDENNMLAKLQGPGTEGARAAFQAMRGVENESGQIAQAVKQLSGGRMPFRYGETKLPKALKDRLAQLLMQMAK